MSDSISTEETSVEDLLFYARDGLVTLNDEERARVDAHKAENPNPTDDASDHADPDPVDPAGPDDDPDQDDHDGSGDKEDPDPGETPDDDGSDQGETTQDDHPRLRAALDYQTRGWAPTPTTGKSPFIPAWHDQPFPTEADVRGMFANRKRNVGVRTGAISGNLTDIDLDHPRARQLAGAFLPKTGTIFGRASSPRSHWLYVVIGRDDVPFMDFPNLTGGNIAELRGDKRQTIFPPSTNLTAGEDIRWDADGDLADVDYDDLVRRVGYLSAAVLLGDLLADNAGNRHTPSLALFGGMAMAGVDRKLAADMVSIVCKTVPDASERDLSKALESTYDKVELGEIVSGFGTAHETTGTLWLRRFRKYLGIEDPDVRERVDVGDPNLNRVTDKIISALDDADHSRGEGLFVGGGGGPVRVRYDGQGDPFISQAGLDDVRHEIVRAVRCTRRPKATKANLNPEPVEVAPPLEIVRNVLAQPSLPFPALFRIATAPTFGRNGQLQRETGYLTSGDVFVHLSDLAVPVVSSNPSDRAKADAVALIRDVFQDFPFATPSDFANTVALMLLPFGRDLIDGATPMHAVEASTPGSGKNLLVQTATIPAVGPAGATMMPEPSDDAEAAKKITSKLLSGSTFVGFSNINRPIDYGTLSEALTAPVWEDRRLGTNLMTRIPIRAAWIATGNNIEVSTEMARRIVPIRLTPDTDRPFHRTGFTHDLPAWAAQNRGRLVWAALTCWSAWIAAGRPAGTATLGSFDAWAATMGGVLQVAGIDGFLGNAAAFFEASDTEGTIWREFVAAWWDAFGSTEVTTAELSHLPIIGSAFDLGTGDLDSKRKKFGRMVAKKRDVFMGDLAIRQGELSRGGVRLYRLTHRDGTAKPKAEKPKTSSTPFGSPNDVIDLEGFKVRRG